jgi:hypothetical protein
MIYLESLKHSVKECHDANRCTRVRVTSRAFVAAKAAPVMIVSTEQTAYVPVAMCV